MKIPQLSGADAEDDAELAPLPSADNLAECGEVLTAVVDVLSWLDEEEVLDTAKGVRLDAGVHSFLKLLHCFAGDLHIRRSRADDPEHVPAGYLIAEHKHGLSRLPAKSEDTVRHMVRHGLLRFDDADVIRVTDKGRIVFEK